jgi:predicted PurR-regulated permease PerM
MIALNLLEAWLERAIFRDQMKHRPQVAAKPEPKPEVVRYPDQRLQFRCDLAAWVIMGVALVAILWLHLIAGLLAGLLVFELVQVIAARHTYIGVSRRAGGWIAVGLVTSVTVLALVFGALSLADLVTDKSDNLPALVQKMADIIGSARIYLPPWAQEHLPANVSEMEQTAASWLRIHAGDLQDLGERAGGVLLHLLVGMIIGAMVALTDLRPTRELPVLSRSLEQRVSRLGQSFRRIVFAQIRISALNTCLTAIYLVVILPMLGVHLPLTKTMILVTFVAGLLPVIGNLISNTVIVVVSLSVSMYAALGSLVFLVGIHKLEYFVNARIIGGQIHARAWELLLAMLVMDAIFGIPGVIAAPIYYAYIKDELKARGLV